MVTTKYDNIKLCKITEFVDYTTYNQWANDYIYPISLKYDGSSVITKARVDNSKGTYNDFCIKIYKKHIIYDIYIN